MPRFYEEAAQLLRALAALGLALCWGVSPHEVISRLETHFHMSPSSRRTHAEIAMAMLSDLEARKLVTCERSRRAILIAALGTAIGNHRTRAAARNARGSACASQK